SSGLSRFLQHGIETVLQLLREKFVVEFYVKLEVQSQTPRVPVCRAEANPGTVYKHQLGMVEWPTPFMDARAMFKDLPVMCLRSPFYKFVVAILRNDNVYLNAAQGRSADGGNHRLIGQKIGCPNTYPRLRGVDSTHEYPSHAIQGFVRSGLHSARKHSFIGRTVLSGVKLPEFTLQPRVGAIKPVPREGLPQMLEHRSPQFEMQIAHCAFRCL